MEKTEKNCIFDGHIDVRGCWCQIRVWRGAGFLVDIRDARGDGITKNVQNFHDEFGIVYDLLRQGMPHPIAYDLWDFLRQIVRITRGKEEVGNDEKAINQ